MNHLTMASILVVVLLLAGGYMMFVPPPIEKSMIVQEGPLKKVAPLGLKNGDEFTYLMTFNGTNSTLDYLVVDGGICRRLIADYTKETVCVFQDGTDQAGSNVTLGQDFIFFRPWMLAVTDDWAWKVVIIAPYPFPKEMDRITYRTVGREEIYGRQAYVVGIYNAKDQLIAKDWVDIEKRVLLKEDTSVFTISLLS